MKKYRKIIYAILASIMLVAMLVMPAYAVSEKAVPTPSPLLVNGTQQELEGYLICDNNYFRLRDIAYILNGTEKQFGVSWDSSTRAINLTSGERYVSVGGELESTGNPDAVATSLTADKVFLNGNAVSLVAYNIYGNNYVKLRDIAEAMDFGVTYIPESKIIEIDTSVGYTADVVDFSNLTVTLIGDSVGIHVAPYLQAEFPNVYADNTVSRQFSAAKGVAQALEASGNLGSVVVIELGTNGTIYESHLRALIEYLGSDRKIVFCSVQAPRSWIAGNNATLASVCAEYSNTIIADWYGASEGHSEYLWSDGVHPNSTGDKVLGQLVCDAVKEIVSS